MLLFLSDNGVTNLKVEIVTENSFKIIWKQPSSCYERLGINLIVANEEGHSQEHKVFKDATSYTVGGLNASATYIIHMFTKYGTDDYFEMSDAVTLTIPIKG